MYTLDDLRGRYVRVGTPEAEIFLDACEELGIVWASYDKPREVETPEGLSFFVSSDGKIRGQYNDEFHNTSPFTPKPQWSIYTNDKPLCELSDEQAATLFNAWRGGEHVIYQRIGNDYEDVSVPCWTDSVVYRIKQKSDRDRFIEACQGGDFGAVYDEFIRG